MQKVYPRLKNITNLQNIAVFMVVLGHCHPLSLDSPLSPHWQRYIHEMIYSFNMPLFFALAGFLFFYKFKNQDIQYKRFISNKFFRLILPYFLLGTVGYLIKTLLFNHFAFRHSAFSISAYLNNFIFPTTNAIVFYWFLPTIFLIFIIAPLLKTIYCKSKISSIALVLGSILLYCFNPFREISFLNIGGVVSYIFSFVLGFVLCEYRDLINKVKFKFLIILLLLFLLNYLVFLPKMYIINIFTSIIGIIICYLFTNGTLNRKFKILDILDDKYYHIYLLSWFFQMPVRLLFQVGLIGYEATFVLMLLAGLFLPILTVNLVYERFLGLKQFVGFKVSEMSINKTKS
ncbi:MAG: acyltransferase family protein [bacterium]